MEHETDTMEETQLSHLFLARAERFNDLFSQNLDKLRKEEKSFSESVPKITIEGTNIIALSPQSPLGSKLMGNKVGFEFEINTTKYTIQEIY